MHDSSYKNSRNFLHRSIVLLALVFLLLAAACQPVSAARDVRVGLYEVKPSLFTNDQGQPDGVFADIIRDIAAREDWNVIWVRGTLAESWDRLSSGRIDLMPGVVDTTEREKIYDFNHETAMSAWSQVYAPPGSGIRTILDLDGKRVAMLRGDINAVAFKDYVRKFSINTTFIETDTLDDVFSMTARGDADAAVTFSVFSRESVNRYGLTETPVMFNPTSMGFAVQKGKNGDLLVAIDRYLDEVKGDPSSTYSQTMHKWFGMKASWEVPPYFWWGLAGISGLAALFVIMNFILRREVRKKTAELSRQNRELQSEVESRTNAEEELFQKNEEIQAAYNQLASTGDELKAKYHELGRSEEALMQARKKLSVLNSLTFQEIQSGIFSIGGYIELVKRENGGERSHPLLLKAETILQSLDHTLNFAKDYQDLGISQPRWQEVNYVLINAISHLDFSRIRRTVALDGLEIYADPLLEKALFNLLDNILRHGAGADCLTVSYREGPEGITILLGDNGPGIPASDKEKIFGRGYTKKGGYGLFLAREILSVTNISIRENGEPGKGALFEIAVPRNEYRFRKTDT